MDHSVKVRPGGNHLIIVHGKMRVEFAGDAFKAAFESGMEGAGPAALVHHDAGNIGRRFIDDLAQAPP